MANPYVEEILSFVPAICILMVLLALIKGMSMFATKRRLSADYKRTLIPQFLVVITAFVGILIIILALPISGETRGQVLGLFGVVFTGIIALSSTTFVTNAHALKKVEADMEKIKKRIEKVDEILGADEEKGKDPL